MTNCWDKESAKRPTAEEALQVISAWQRIDRFDAIFLEGKPQSRPKLETKLPRSVCTSRFVPSIPALESYMKKKIIEITGIDDDEWETIVSYCTLHCLKMHVI
jgi:hypothetical protein